MRCRVPGRGFTIHFPDGDFELDARTELPPPAVGETLRRKGHLWKVTARSEGPPVMLRVEQVMQSDGPTSEPPVLRLRFPDGDVELRWTEKKLPVGVLVRSRGVLWRVSSSDDRGVILEPASPEDGARFGPELKPTPLGEGDSLLLETITEI
jgi:hypothetical protein